MVNRDRLLNILRWAAFVIACFAQLSSGIVFLFSVFQNTLKDTYNYTQSEVALLASLSNFGVGMAFIPGGIYDRFGPTVASIGGFFLTAGGYLLVWSTTQSIHFYKDKSWLLGIFFFIGGNGSTFTYMTSLNTSMLNFSEKFRGTICGVVNCFFSAGPATLIYVYYEFFVHGSPDIDTNHDYPGFMLTNSIIFAAVNGLCIIFLRVYKTETFQTDIIPMDLNVTELSSRWYFKTKARYQLQNTQPDDNIDSLYSEKSGSIGQLSKVPCNTSDNDGLPIKVVEQNASSKSNMHLKNENQENPDVQTELVLENKTKESMMDMLKDSNFHLLMWMFGISSAVGTVVMNNVTTTKKSMDQTSFDTYVVLIIPIFGVIVSILAGIFSDYLKAKFPRTYFLMLFNAMFVISGILNTSWAYNLPTFMISTGIHGIAMAIAWSITPTYLSELYHTDNFGKNWGICLVVSAILVFVMQQIFASLYDSKITEAGGIVCYEFKCVQSGYGVLLASSVIALILNIALIFNLKCKK